MTDVPFDTVHEEKWINPVASGDATVRTRADGLSVIGRAVTLAAMLFGGFLALFLYVLHPEPLEQAGTFGLFTQVIYAFYLAVVMSLFFTLTIYGNPEADRE